jgi:DnaJ homologue, subfamily C, member 28, conserved domain
VAFERIAEQRIRQAMKDGEFDGLPNAGRPIDLDDYFKWPESMRMAYSILKSANCVPEEIEIINDIARLEASLAAAREAAEQESIRRTLASRRTELAVRLERARARR